MANLLLCPPLAFIIILAVSLLLALVSAKLAFKRQGGVGGLKTSYTGGELVPTHRVQPDYTQFFPFAFFFMILHVTTLVLATVPMENPGSFAIALLYLIGVVIGLKVLFRK